MDFRLFLIPMIIMFLVQLTKVALYKKGGFGWDRLKVINEYGGMPSAHSALVSSLCLTMAYYQGISSPGFAVAIVLALIIVRDSFGFRQAIGEQGKIINRLVKELPDKQEYKFPILGERFGHRTIEVIVGVLVGLLLTYALMLLWN
jgi:uncharacterized protein